MIKLFMVALMAISLASSALAKDTKVGNTVAAGNFKSEFKRATDVNWTASETYIKASFILGGERMEAYYTPSGEKIGTSRAIAVEELPTGGKRQLTKKYGSYTIKEAIEFNGTEESAYYVSAENDKESVVLKITSGEGVTVVKRTAK